MRLSALGEKRVPPAALVLDLKSIPGSGLRDLGTIRYCQVLVVTFLEQVRLACAYENCVITNPLTTPSGVGIILIRTAGA